MSHPDTAKMWLHELEACGCKLCEQAIRIHTMLNQLIASQDKTIAALDRMSDSVTELEKILKTK